MHLFETLYSYLLSNIKTTLISVLIAFIVYKLARFYFKLSALPPGPIPLPILGNVLLFKKTKHHWDSAIREVSTKYGSIFTFWFGNNPFIFITDLDIAREAFRKNEFSGRPVSYFGNQLSNDKSSDIVFTDYGHTWEALRRVAHSAVQKYAVTDRLVYMASDCVDQTIDLIVKREGLNKTFNPFDYIYYMFLNILSASVFGKLYDIEDPEYKKIKYGMRDFSKDAGSRFLLWEISSFFRLLDYKMVRKHKSVIRGVVDLIRDKYKSHYKDYSEAEIRDFCDALISAKNDALKEGKESTPYLNDENLSMAIFDLFLAGTDTSQQTFQWMLLLMLYYKEVMNKLKEEIESEIGDRIPTHEDRNRCHYVMAFISETLRYRNVIPTGLFHKVMVNSKLGEFTIEKGSTVFVHQGAIMNDPKYWTDPEQFKPERFIENGKYLTTRPSAFIPFGLGRRVCLGEKLAIADLFLVLVRFIQKTSEYNVVLESDVDTEADPYKTDAFHPKSYEISFKS